MNPRKNRSPNNLKEHRTNRQIRASYVYLIDSVSDKGRRVSFDEALSQALSENMDLVEFSIGPEGPVCKIIDYGKYCFEQNKNKVKPKKHDNKTIQLNINIQENDFLIRLQRAKKFLESKFKIQIIMKMPGRQSDYPEFAMKMFDRFIEYCKDVGRVESGPKVEGKRGFLIMNSTVK